MVSIILELPLAKSASDMCRRKRATTITSLVKASVKYESEDYTDNKTDDDKKYNDDEYQEKGMKIVG